MDRPDIQEEFKQILEYAIQRGNENMSITVEELLQELTSQLRPLFEKANA